MARVNFIEPGTRVNGSQTIYVWWINWVCPNSGVKHRDWCLNFSSKAERDDAKKFAMQLLNGRVSDQHPCRDKRCQVEGKKSAVSRPKVVVLDNDGEHLKTKKAIGFYRHSQTLWAMARELVCYRNVSTRADERQVIDLIVEIHRAAEHPQPLEGCEYCPATQSGPVFIPTDAPWKARAAK